MVTFQLTMIVSEVPRSPHVTIRGEWLTVPSSSRDTQQDTVLHLHHMAVMVGGLVNLLGLWRHLLDSLINTGQILSNEIG
jgi:hypothetical protein